MKVLVFAVCAVALAAVAASAAAARDDHDFGVNAIFLERFYDDAGRVTGGLVEIPNDEKTFANSSFSVSSEILYYGAATGSGSCNSCVPYTTCDPCTVEKQLTTSTKTNFCYIVRVRALVNKGELCHVALKQIVGSSNYYWMLVYSAGSGNTECGARCITLIN